MGFTPYMSIWNYYVQEKHLYPFSSSVRLIWSQKLCMFRLWSFVFTEIIKHDHKIQDMDRDSTLKEKLDKYYIILNIKCEIII
jgi:hypothetical protein